MQSRHYADVPEVPQASQYHHACIARKLTQVSQGGQRHGN